MSYGLDKNSPRYIVNHYRSIEQEESALDSFLFWLQWDCDSFDDKKLPEMERLIDEYLGRNMSKIKQSEQALLGAWTLASQEK
jgi:hypothetical protein